MFPKIAQFKTADALRLRLAELGVSLPLDDHVQSAAEGSPLAAPLRIGRRTAGNRWCIHPMEGWDANADGSPSEHTLRRWRRFGISGAKLIWGGEAAAVRPDGRANPRQTLATAANEPGLRRLRETLEEAHRERFGADACEDLVVGLQLTHSGRWCKPVGTQFAPRIAWHHPLLDRRLGIDPRDDSVVWTDEELERLIEQFVEAAGVAHRAGYSFVDVKACHGYLLHEFLGARGRSGPYGGDYTGRTRLLRTIVSRVREAHPELDVVVRMSVFDMPPFVAGAEHGEPMPHPVPYECGFGVDPERPLEFDLSEPLRLMGDLAELGVAAINVSAGSPYYNPHIQRPAFYPPSDGYRPPEDPLVGVARQLEAARLCKQTHPALPMVGTGYSYLQEHLPHVAQAAVREGWIDSVGLGRMVLSYPDLPADCLSGRPLQRRLLCRTFSDCTTAPRNGLVSGCYPLDEHYKSLPEGERLKGLK